MGFKDDGDLVLVLGEDKGELGGSEYLQMQYGLARGNHLLLIWKGKKHCKNWFVSSSERGYSNLPTIFPKVAWPSLW